MNERGSTEFFSQKQQEDGYRKIKYSTCAEVIIIIEINMTPPIQETEGQPAAMSVESSTSSVTAEANVGLPVSTSDEEEDSSSGDEALTAAGDDLCRSLQKEALTPKRKTAHGGDLNIEANSTTELSLEERVQDLETKLATLSRILQQQQRLSVRSLLTRSPSNSQRSLSPHPRLQVPDLSSGNDQNHGSDYCHPPDSPPHSQQQQRQQHTNSKGMVPYLESPAPFDDCSPRERKKHQRQRLSFHLLYDGNEDNLNRGDDEDHLQKSETTNNSSNPHMMPNSNHFQDSNSNANSENGASEPEQDNHLQSENNDKREEEEESHPLKSDASPQWKSEKKSHINSTIVDTAVSVIANEAKGQFKSKKEEDSSEKLERSGTSLDKDQLKKNKSSYVAATTNSNQQQQQQQQQQAGQDSASSITNAGSSHSANAIATTTSTTATTGLLQPLLLSKDKRSKWLDHLNSFQESNHDVDVQMQEFIKVPGSVEKTLSFGLLICIDSFLYVCTILPIRFAWSCVLLSLHYFFKWTKKPAGNYQFHRRYVCEIVFRVFSCASDWTTE